MAAAVDAAGQRVSIARRVTRLVAIPPTIRWRVIGYVSQSVCRSCVCENVLAWSSSRSFQIVESYAFEVASEVAVRCKRRKVAPIPINWDDEDDDEDNSLQDN